MKMSPEFLPLIEWWEKYGKQWVTVLLVAGIAAGGWYGWKHHRQSVRAAASLALANAYTLEELEEAAVKFKGTDAAGAIGIRLAKSYFDNARYDEAKAVYDELLANPPDGFADIPAVGAAQCLEALGRFADARKAFDDFATANPKSYLALTARLGSARCQAQAGDSKGALDKLAAIKAEVKDDMLSKARTEATEDVVKRYVKPATTDPEAKPETK